MIQKWLQRGLHSIYSYLRKSRYAYLCFPGDIARNLKRMGKDEKTYYEQKITYTGGLILAGIVFGVFYLGCQKVRGEENVTFVQRPAADEEAKEIILQAGNQKEEYRLEIEPRMLSKTEADALAQEFLLKINDYILGENESMDMVTENLFLPIYVDGYPFEIYWESDKEAIIDTAGGVHRVGLKEDEIVILTAVLDYQDWSWEEQFGVMVCKESLSEEASYSRKLGQLLKEAEAAQREKEIWTLPEYFEGEKLSYQQKQKNYDLLIVAGLCVAAGAAIWIGQDYDLKLGREKRQQIFKEEYTTLVSSLALYIAAGMNLQTAVTYCVQDYIERRPEGDFMRECLQDLQKNLRNGQSFSAAMEHFAEAADDANYRKLAGILNQGLLNGSRGLAQILQQEAEMVREDKRRRIKIKGEQMSTALIGPMMLQLGIVIALIMIPAFTGLNF